MILFFFFSRTIYFKSYEIYYFLSIIKNVYIYNEKFNVYLYNILLKIINIQKENEKKKENFYNSIFIFKFNKYTNRKVINYNNICLNKTNYKFELFKKNNFEKFINNNVDIEDNFNVILKYYIFFHFNLNQFIFYYYYLDYFISIEYFEKIIKSEKIYYINLFAFLSYNYNKSRENNIIETLKQIIVKEKFKTINLYSYKINNDSIKLLNNTNINILDRNLNSLTQNFPNLSGIIKKNKYNFKRYDY